MIAPDSLSRWQNAVPYATPLMLAPLAWLCAYWGGWAVLLVPIVTWNTYTTLDSVLGLQTDNADPNTPDERLFWYKAITAVWPPIQFVTLFGLIWFTTRADHLSTIELIGIFFGVGVITGTLGINYSHGLAEACHAHGLPLVVWEIDPSTDVLRPCATPTDHARVFTYRRANLDGWRRAGFAPTYLPLAADPQRRRPVDLSPQERARFGGPVAFVGSSGVGKTSLLNALMGEEAGSVGAVRDSDRRGQHTTTRRELHQLPGGGLLLDTPGMRELALWDEAGIDAVFADIVALAEQCRFRDCGHDGEPGCAVAAAVEAGELDPGRLVGWHKLRREAERQALRRDVAASRQERRRFAKVIKEAKKIGLRKR